MIFRKAFMLGQVDFDTIFDLTDEWSSSDDPRTLREYLGLTPEEEDIWITESDEALEDFMMKERSRKVFFTDLDGTLLTDEKKIKPDTKQAIHEALRMGHLVVLASGRTLSSTLRQAKKLDLIHPGCYLICYNGALIYDIGAEKTLYTSSLSMDLVIEAFRTAEQFNVHIQTYAHDDTILALHDTPIIEAYCSVQGLSWKIVDDISSSLTAPPPKMLAIENDPEKLEAFRVIMEEKFHDKLDMFQSQSNYLELVSPGTNKGNAVRKLCDILQIPIENSVSAGDAENDLTLIQAAHIGAVMVNGSPVLKEYADYITENDNNHDGVAEIIHKFVTGTAK